MKYWLLQSAEHRADQVYSQLCCEAALAFKGLHCDLKPDGLNSLAGAAACQQVARRSTWTSS